jgi:hypothetical protein
MKNDSEGDFRSDNISETNERQEQDAEVITKAQHNFTGASKLIQDTPDVQV